MILGYVIIVFIVWNNMSILEYLDFNKIEQIDYWNDMRSHLNVINGIGAFLIFATSSTILAFLLFTLTYYLRLYQNGLRIIFQEVFDFLNLIPCVFWSFLFFLIFQLNFNLGTFGNLAMLLLINSIMIFPMLLNAIFKAINSMSDGYIQTGYALGANSFEIAFLLVAPKLIKPISAAIVLIFTRLIIELAILAVVIGIWSMSAIALSIVLIIAVSGILVFLLKRF
jgi:ABC-type Fe3+ transport system permease subunit